MSLMRGIKRIYRAVRGDEKARYQLADKITQVVCPRYKFTEFGRAYLYDRDFLDIYERIEGTRNYHSLDRKYALRGLLQLATNVPGATAECGVFRGGSSWLICQHFAGTGRKHYLFDSFEGVSTPGSHDGSWWTRGNLAMPEEVARKNLADFPAESLVFMKGWIPDRFPEVEDQTFSFVHIDVDLYEPTRDSIEFFYPRLSPGGVLLCDDDGSINCPGAKKAMDEFFADKPESIVRLPTGQSFVVRQAAHSSSAKAA
ncbi:MAG TPA: TylF/MycF/NovP-related O-methyltransferase [Pirellulales bacterium]